MTRDESIKVLMMIQAAYPNYHPQDKTVAVDTWQTLLEDYSYQQVSSGLKAYIVADRNGFPPSPGQVIDKIQFLGKPRELNDLEAWAMVSRALRNGYYGAEMEFQKLPPLVQKAVGSPENLRNWAQTDTQSVENVIQSNFIKAYRTVLARESEIAKMPGELLAMITETNREMDRLCCVERTEVIEEHKERPEGIPMPEKMRRRMNELLGGGNG